MLCIHNWYEKTIDVLIAMLMTDFNYLYKWETENSHIYFMVSIR